MSRKKFHKIFEFTFFNTGSNNAWIYPSFKLQLLKKVQNNLLNIKLLIWFKRKTKILVSLSYYLYRFSWCAPGHEAQQFSERRRQQSFDSSACAQLSECEREKAFFTRPNLFSLFSTGDWSAKGALSFFSFSFSLELSRETKNLFHPSTKP